MGDEITDRLVKAAADEAENMAKEERTVMAPDIKTAAETSCLNKKKAAAMGSGWFWKVLIFIQENWRH